MDGFTGFKTATTEELPDAVAVMDPFHVVRLAGDALDQCRRRVQQATCGHRGRKGDPLYAARRTLHTGADLLTDKQRQRLTALFADDDHVEVEATWGIYQRIVAAYREPDRKRGRELMQQLIGSLSHGVPTALHEVITLGRTLRRAPPTSWPTSTGPAPPTARPKRSTADSNTSAAPPSASATSPTTSPDRYWKPADSDPNYTLNHEEPARPNTSANAPTNRLGTYHARRRCAAKTACRTDDLHPSAPHITQPIRNKIIGDLISCRNDGKGCAAIADNVSKP